MDARVPYCGEYTQMRLNEYNASVNYWLTTILANLNITPEQWLASLDQFYQTQSTPPQ
jgi:hypothetical protein